MRGSLRRFCLIATALLPLSAWAGTAVPFTINLSKAVNVVTSGGTPRIAVDVAGTTRYANYTSGSGTSALVFTYNMQAGDVDLDGVAVSSPVQLNGGTIKDLSGNPLTNLTFTPPNTAGIKVNYPSLGMDFTNGAGGRYTLNGTPYTTLASFLTAAGGSFTRASVGTYFDSAGVLQTAAANTPRLDYDPVTHAAKGILIEEARTNLLLRSSEFENAAWGKIAVSVLGNTAAAPDGTATAESLSGDGTSGIHQIRETVTNSAASTFSVYLKQGTERYAYIHILGRTPTEDLGTIAHIDLQSGTVHPSSAVGSSVTNVGNGWYRLSLPRSTAWTSATQTEVRIAVNSVYGLQTSTASGNIYIWGAQLEQGAFPTSYIPTTTAAVTRAADVLSVPTGGWYSASAGTLFSQGAIPETGGSTRRYLSLNDGTAANSIQLASAGNTNAYMEVRNSGAVQVSPVFGSYTAGSLTKIAGAYKLNDFAFTTNGGAVGTDTSGTIPSITQLMFGAHSAVQINGYIQKAKYYPARVPNAQLQLMTQ